MKQRKSKQVRLLSGMLIGIVMIAVLARIVYLNHCYPSPKVITYTENDTIKLGNYEIKQTGWEWGDGSLLKEKCPDYVYHQMDDGSEYHLIVLALHLKWELMVISMTWSCFLN